MATLAWGALTAEGEMEPQSSSGAASCPASNAANELTLTVRTGGCGIALPPTFTAGHREGGYVVVASVGQVKAAFSLVNEGR